MVSRVKLTIASLLSAKALHFATLRYFFVSFTLWTFPIIAACLAGGIQVDAEITVGVAAQQIILINIICFMFNPLIRLILAGDTSEID